MKYLVEINNNDYPFLEKNIEVHAFLVDNIIDDNIYFSYKNNDFIMIIKGIIKKIIL
jgi:hypothetical protein